MDRSSRAARWRRPFCSSLGRGLMHSLHHPPCPPILSMDHSLKIVFWNMRGLNSRAKRTVVHSVLAPIDPCIVCLSETKLSSISLSTVLEILGPSFSDFYFLPALGTRGGILLAWRGDRVALANPIAGTYHVSATVSLGANTPPWWLTGVYGPQDVDDKIAFMAELHELRDIIAGPWLLGGDFNMITSCADKNNGNLHQRTMSRFRRFIADHALRDIYLHGRRYTWSNEQLNHTLVRNDRVLCTPSWETINPQHLLRCLSTATSDHCPSLIDCWGT
ncbi:hypothetical protein ACQJBY_028445 [Aegilops geniculata]